MGRLDIRAEADADIDDIARFIATDDLEAGKRFYDAVAHDLLQLADNPRMGARRRAGDPALRDLRSWPVSGYRNYLIFYLAGDPGIDVLRVMHGARDVERLMKRSV